MPTFNVLVTRDITQSATISIEAKTPDAAMDIALENARNALHGIAWTLADGPCSDPFAEREDITFEDGSLICDSD